MGFKSFVVMERKDDSSGLVGNQEGRVFRFENLSDLLRVFGTSVEMYSLQEFILMSNGKGGLEDFNEFYKTSVEVKGLDEWSAAA
jgi:hypothetical protein